MRNVSSTLNNIYDQVDNKFVNNSSDNINNNQQNGDQENDFWKKGLRNKGNFFIKDLTNNETR